MTDPTQPIQPKKGMSKGCLVALIVGLVILILVVAGVAYVCSNLESLAKQGVVKVVS